MRFLVLLLVLAGCGDRLLAPVSSSGKVNVNVYAGVDTTFNIHFEYPDLSDVYHPNHLYRLEESCVRADSLLSRYLEDVPMYEGMDVDDVNIKVMVRDVGSKYDAIVPHSSLLVRPDSGLPYYGVIVVNKRSLPGLITSDQLDRVVLHEVLHVLGFGVDVPVWRNVVKHKYGRWRYEGDKVLSFLNNHVYCALLGSCKESVALDRKGYHWAYSEGTNLMDPSSSGPFSGMTLAALEDIGYTRTAQSDSLLGAMLDPAAKPVASEYVEYVCGVGH